jgi:hypothetical protein
MSEEQFAGETVFIDGIAVARLQYLFVCMRAQYDFMPQLVEKCLPQCMVAVIK